MSNRTYENPEIPDGHYAVPDPDDPGRLTLWEVRAGVPRDWPKGTRWRPRPPSVAHIDQDKRTEARQRWYDGVYFPWREQVSQAIVRAPDAAAAAFVEAAGHQEIPQPAGRSEGQSKRVTRTPKPRTPGKRELAVLAAALHAGGRSWRAVGELLDLPKPTAHRIGRGVPPYYVPDGIVAALALVRAYDVRDQVRADRRKATDPAEQEALDRRLAELETLLADMRKRSAGRAW